jgi:hypothetical protein
MREGGKNCDHTIFPFFINHSCSFFLAASQELGQTSLTGNDTRFPPKMFDQAANSQPKKTKTKSFWVEQKQQGTQIRNAKTRPFVYQCELSTIG